VNRGVARACQIAGPVRVQLLLLDAAAVFGGVEARVRRA